MSKDYKDGYREGFLDGFKAARDNPFLVEPVVPQPNTNTFTPPKLPIGCSVCNLDFKVAWGYVCYRSNCPVKVTC